MVLLPEIETPKLTTWALLQLQIGRRLFESSCSSLRERLENSNYILLKIPIEIHHLLRGRQLICLDRERSREELGLHESEHRVSTSGWPGFP